MNRFAPRVRRSRVGLSVGGVFALVAILPLLAAAQSSAPPALPTPPQIESELVERFWSAVIDGRFDEAADRLKATPALIDTPTQEGYAPLGRHIPLDYAQDEEGPTDRPAMVERMQWLLDHGAHIDLRWNGGRSALQAAARYNRSDALHFLVDHGAKLNLSGPDDGATALLLAFQFMAPADVQYLLDQGADRNAVDTNGNGIMQYAIDASPPLPAMELAFRAAPACLDRPNQDGEAALSLLIWDADMRRVADRFRSPDWQKWRDRDRPALQFLLDHGADLKRVAATGATDLIFAVRAHNLDLVQRCIAAGVNLQAQATKPILRMPSCFVPPNAPRTFEATALDEEYLDCFEPDIATCLLDHGAGSADDLEPDSGSRSSLIPVAQSYSPEVYAEEHPDRQGPLPPEQTPLLLLLSHGWNPNQPAADTHRPLQAAAFDDGRDEATTLLKFGALPNLADQRGFTPLHTAAAGDQLAAVKLLLAHGGDPGQRNRDGHTPLEEFLGLYDWSRGMLGPVNEPPPVRNMHSPLAQVLYAAQEDRVNCGLWLGFGLAVLALAGFLYRRHRRARARSDAAAVALPDAVWNEARWQTLAPRFEKAARFQAAASNLRVYGWMALGACGFLAGLHWIDPVLWRETDATAWRQLGLVGGLLLSSTGCLYLPWRRLRLAVAVLGLTASACAGIIFVWDGFRAIQTDWLFAVGGLLIAGALVLLATLYPWLRMAYLEAAIVRLKLPFALAAKPPGTVEAPPLEARHGWDEAAPPPDR